MTPRTCSTRVTRLYVDCGALQRFGRVPLAFSCLGVVFVRHQGASLHGTLRPCCHGTRSAGRAFLWYIISSNSLLLLLLLLLLAALMNLDAYGL